MTNNILEDFKMLIQLYSSDKKLKNHQKIFVITLKTKKKMKGFKSRAFSTFVSKYSLRAFENPRDIDQTIR